jgi:hypothetical protein
VCCSSDSMFCASVCCLHREPNGLFPLLQTKPTSDATERSQSGSPHNGWVLPNFELLVSRRPRRRACFPTLQLFSCARRLGAPRMLTTSLEGAPAAGVDNRPAHPRHTRLMKGGFVPIRPDSSLQERTMPSPPPQVQKLLSPQTPRTVELRRLHKLKHEGIEAMESPRTNVGASWRMNTDNLGRAHMFRERAKPAEADQLMFSRNSFELSTREPYQRPVLLEPPSMRSKANRMKRALLKAEHAKLKSQLAALEEEAAAGFPLGRTSGYLTLDHIPSPTKRPATTSSMATVSSASTAWYLVQHGKERALSPLAQDMEWTYTPRLPQAAAARLPKPGDWALAFQNTK